MSNQFLKLRRSAVPGRIPTTSSLDFGEIALNTYDGLAFMKKSGSNGEEIVTLGTGTGGGSANITGSQYFLPVFNSTSSLITSSIYQSGSFTAIRDTSPLDPTNPDILLVQGNGVNSYNLISAHGNLNSYVQVNVQNFSAGLTASADIVATNNIGDEESYFINMGINGDGYNVNGGIGSQNDAYLYSTGENLLIGNASQGKSVILFNGTGSAVENARVYINPGGTVGINTSDTNISNPESLLVEPLSNSQTDFNNLIVGKGIINENYLQLNITNLGTGSAASSDVVATNNIGDETSYYIDMGVNSSNYNIPNAVGTGSDAYLYSTARHLHIGNASNYPIQFFVGGLDSEANRKLQLNVNSQHELTGSLNATQGFTGSLFGTASWALNVITASYALTASYLSGNIESASFATTAISSSYPIAVTGSSIYSNGIGSRAPIYNVPGGYFQDGEVIPYVVYLGYDAGRNANSSYATFIGYRAGLSASFSDDSVFIGENAGEEASNAVGSNFIGVAGFGASYAEYSNFMGYLAGNNAYTSSYSNFIGRQTGENTVKSQFSNFIGLRSGQNASQVNYSNFIGADTGRLAISSSYSNLIGYRVGYNVAGGANGIGTNNIIIGTNITLGTGRKDSINLGGLIFGTGSYATTTGNPFSGSANGRIGINQPNPIFNLDVSGSGRYTNGLTVTSSLLAPDITGSLFGTASWAVSASHALSSLTASFAISASYTVSSSNSQTASYVNPLNQKVIITGSLIQGLEGNIATGEYSHAEGSITKAIGDYSHAEGDNTQAVGNYSHTQGQETIASGSYSHAEGYSSIARGQNSHAEGFQTIASGSYSHAEGDLTVAIGYASHAEGDNTQAIGDNSHAEGDITQAIGYASHAEGSYAEAIGDYSHAEGDTTIASGNASHAEGINTIASGSYSHAEGGETIAVGTFSHAEGVGSIAGYGPITPLFEIINTPGHGAHAEGFLTLASGSYSHTEGESTLATGRASHAEGLGTVALGDYQHVQGQYNISSSVQSAFIVGNGTDDANRSNLIFAAGNAVQITGSLGVTQGITGSLFGTASWALNVITASYILNAVSASFAATASSADNFTVRGTLTAQTIVAQTITSSTEYVTGSTIFGSLLSNTHQFTGSVSITGSLAVNGSSVVLSNQTGSMSVATASFASSSISASFASTASYVLNAVSASYAATAALAPAYVLTSTTGSMLQPYVLTSQTSSMSVATASFATSSLSASYAATASIATSASFAFTASYVLNAVSSSFASTASYALNGGVTQIVAGTNVTISPTSGTGSITINATAGAAFPYTGSAIITGSLTVTGSTNLQVLNIGASQLNNTSSATAAGTTTVSSIATGSFTSAFYNYTIASGSNARAGQVMSVWSGGTIRYTEVTTTDIGNTATASFAVALSGANVNLSFTAPGVWTVKSIANLL